MKKPFALTLDNWERWHKNAKAKHPVRYLFTESIPRYWGRVLHRVRDGWWWVRHRIDPRHRYHVVHSGLPAGYYDKPELMLHVNFNLLVLFIEKEKPFEWFDTEDSPHKESWIEVKRLYEWWKHERPKRKDPIDDADTNSPEWPDVCRKSLEFDDAAHSEDQAMLHRLINVRSHLWT